MVPAILINYWIKHEYITSKTENKLVLHKYYNFHVTNNSKFLYYFFIVESGKNVLILRTSLFEDTVSL